MEYTRSVYVGDSSYDERFEGEPKEILELIDGIEDKKDDFIYNQEEAVNFIFKKLRENERFASVDLLYEILELEEDYMRSVGIIED